MVIQNKSYYPRYNYHRYILYYILHTCTLCTHTVYYCTCSLQNYWFDFIDYFYVVFNRSSNIPSLVPVFVLHATCTARGCTSVCVYPFVFICTYPWYHNQISATSQWVWRQTNDVAWLVSVWVTHVMVSRVMVSLRLLQGQ